MPTQRGEGVRGLKRNGWQVFYSPLAEYASHGFALSGQARPTTNWTQGVALGWFVVAPLGRHRTDLRPGSVFCAVAILLFAVELPSSAAESRLADAAQRCISPERVASASASADRDGITNARREWMQPFQGWDCFTALSQGSSFLATPG
jgi:hypothetical protein